MFIGVDFDVTLEEGVVIMDEVCSGSKIITRQRRRKELLDLQFWGQEQDQWPENESGPRMRSYTLQ